MVAIALLEIVVDTMRKETVVMLARFVKVDVDLFAPSAHVHPNDPQLLPIMFLAERWIKVLTS